MKKVAFVFIVLFSGCATKNEIIDENLTKPAEIRHTNSDNSSKISHPNLKNSSDFDPLYGYNVTMTYINDAFYAYLFLPLAAGYDYVMPDPIQGAFSDFFHNLLYPVRLVNNLLQGKFASSWIETKRFLINSTLGFGGLADSAKLHFDLARNDEDFGQTLGAWGVGEGAPFVLPIFGQSSLRDALGVGVDGFVNPINYVGSQWHHPLVISGVKELNERSISWRDYYEFRKAPRLYERTKEAYRAKRDAQISE